MDNGWEQVLRDMRYQTLEDPFSGMCVPKEEFDAVYGPACIALFADLQVDMVFEQNPVIQGEWRYADNDARDDLYDTAIEMGLVQSSDEVQQGESFEEERVRKSKQERVSDQAAQGRAATIEEKSARLLRVNALLDQDRGELSGKQRKKLIRERRSLVACIDSSSESVS